MIGDASPLFMLGMVVLAGFLGSLIARRLHLPAITGQILVGILLGPSVIGLFQKETPTMLLPVTHFALGLMTATVGSHLRFRSLWNAKNRLLVHLGFEAFLTPLLVFSTLIWLPGVSWPLALFLSCLAIPTAPDTTVAVIKETRARGVFVKTLLASVALNNILAVLAFELIQHVVLAIQVSGPEHEWTSILIQPARQLFLSAAIGLGIGALTSWLAEKRLVPPSHHTSLSVIALLFASGLAQVLDASSLLSSLFLGIAFGNFAARNDKLGHGVFDDLEQVIFAAFFTLAGIKLDFHYALEGGAVALVLFFVRVGAKSASGYLAMKLAGATKPLRHWLGLGLIPQAGLVIGLLLVLQQNPAFSDLVHQLLAVGLTAVLLNELAGPLLTRFALKKSGETGMDKSRLLDFLHEEHIITDFEAQDKDEAIAKLCKLLVRTHHLEVPYETLVESVRNREKEISTSIGKGLAIPHAILPEGERIVGVMGISRKGLEIPTPDGRPVHCMVLLATPRDQRNRHLEVLAALAESIGSDEEIRKQLFRANSPAHVCQLLYAKQFKSYNVVLDEEA